MEPVTVTLAHPIQHGSEIITELVFRPITAKDYRRCKFRTSRGKDGSAEEQPFALLFELAGYLSGQPTQVIDKLIGPDANRVMEVVSGFLPSGPGTGTEP